MALDNAEIYTGAVEWCSWRNGYRWKMYDLLFSVPVV